MKLQNGYGSVTKLSGKRRKPWSVRVTLGWDIDLENQKSIQQRKLLGTYGTRKEAMIALADYNKNPFDIASSSMTFGELYSKWSEFHFPRVSKSNVNGIVAVYKLCSKVENMRVVDIRLPHLQMIVDESGKNTPTLKKLKVMFGLMFEYAVMNEIVGQEKRDMIKYLDVTSAGNPDSRERVPFSDDEITALWNSKDTNIYYTVVLIMIYSGVRISELLDLKKSDVHLDDRWFYVRKSKTATGVREVPIAEKIVPFFEYWMQRDCDYLICDPDNNHLLYSNYIRTYWKPLITNHLPHDTRHTCVSLLTVAGVDERIIKRIVGHKGQGVTDAIYTHLELPIKLEAINKI